MPNPSRPLSARLASEAGGGLLLMGAAALALVAANGPAGPLYEAALAAPLGPLSLLHWINDGLMALFFLMVGLEIKRELLVGQLRTRADRTMPGLAALGGMVAPALVYAACNLGMPGTLRGFAIPAATDIAFALGVLALLGSRVPASLKVFLTALAILDDLGAVAIIAVFYTADLSWPMLAGAVPVLAALLALDRAGVVRLWPFLLLGAVLWVLVLRSGVHATVAGVLLALTVPLREDHAASPLHRLEHALRPWCAGLVLPVFGFANAGISFTGMGLGVLAAPVTLGVALGLFLGKQAGVFGAMRLAVALGLGPRPAGASWAQVYGVALLCGVGFTMSLFIGGLAFTDRPDLAAQVKVGVLAGSLASALAGLAVLAGAGRRTHPPVAGGRPEH